MVAQCMQDIPDDDDDVDENDPDLLAELQELGDDDDEPPVKLASPPPAAKQKSPSPTPQAASPSDMVSLLQQRLENYKTAQANSKSAGDSSKARRAERGIKVCFIF